MPILPVPMASSPHDALFKETFGQADIARSELEVILPVEVRAPPPH
jgi:predicted transposase YdaD